ncbi:purine phosphoribosyltransferase family protein [Streptomyces sp. M19]
MSAGTTAGADAGQAAPGGRNWPGCCSAGSRTCRTTRSRVWCSGHHPLLADATAFGALTEALAALCAERGADKVVGLEARASSWPPRRPSAPGRLRARTQGGQAPGATLAQRYDLEYGSAEIEMHADALAPGDRVLVIDDVLATGGTAEASLQLIRRAGAEVAGVAVLLELGFLNGRERLVPTLGGAPLDALITV